MTEKALRRLLDVWKDRLGLETWRIDLNIAPCESRSSVMEVERSVYYERASITCAPWVLGRTQPPKGVMHPHPTLDRVETSLVHELLHLPLRDLRCLSDDVVEELPKRQRGGWENAIERAEEQTVDRLAVALVRAFAA